ncbi:MAG: 2-hydroxyacid dehydrogenase [Pseudomonadota bacterium]
MADILLQTGPMMPMVEAQIEKAFEVHAAHKMADREAGIAAISDRVRAIALGGHIKLDGAMLSRFPNLKIVSNFGVGYDSVDAAWAGENGIIVTNTPDVLSEEVADTALALFLMASRELGAAERYLRAGKWMDGAYPLTRTTARDRTVGILGLGRIGKAIARRLDALGVTVAYHGRNRQPDVDYAYHATLHDLATAVDTLMIVVPGGPATDRLVTMDILKALGPNGIVVNIGRGTTIDEAALVQALHEGTIANAGLDVFEKEPAVPAELLAMEKVVLLPHVGSASQHTRDGMGQLLVDNLLAYRDGKPPLTPVAETPFTGW